MQSLLRIPGLVLALTLVSSACQYGAARHASVSPEHWLTPENVGAQPLKDAMALADTLRPSLLLISQELRRVGLDPEEYYVEIEPVGRAEVQPPVRVFHLWHRDIFKPEYQGYMGDPTGKCRTFQIDVVRGQVVRVSWWR